MTKRLYHSVITVRHFRLNARFNGFEIKRFAHS